MKDPVIIRSSRKTIALQMAEDGSLTVRAPRRMSDREIAAFLSQHSTWIEKHRAKMQQAAEALSTLPPFSPAEIGQLAKEAARVIPLRVKHYAAVIGVTYGRITIRRQRTKWGSCSANGNLSFNCLLMAAPPEVLDAVVVHELCHRLHMDHSSAFYAEVRRAFPDYDKWNRWLKEEGMLLMRRGTAVT